MPQPRRACAVRVTVVILSVCLTVRVNAYSRTTGYQGGRQQEVAKKMITPSLLLCFAQKIVVFHEYIRQRKKNKYSPLIRTLDTIETCGVNQNYL